MICKNCNKENIEGRKYCFYCGSELVNTEQEKVLRKEEAFLKKMIEFTKNKLLV